ncbi:MAG: ATP-binding protein [Anaerolineae bacterium]
MAKADLILILLDESPTLHLMDRALRATGFLTAIVHDLMGLNKALQETSPSLVLIGERFAGESGLHLSEEMRERFPTLPIILFAERESLSLLKAALQAGLSDCLIPPLRTDDIVGAVRRSLERANRLGDWLRREVKRTTASLEERAKISETERAKLEAIFANIQDGVIVLDEQVHILFINNSVREAFKLGKENVSGRPLLEVISHDDVKALLERSDDNPLKYHEINFDDGRVFNAQYTPIPHIGSAITLQDITYLKELDRMKNDFVHTISHDLRSPLTALLGYTELLDRIGPLNEQQREFLERIQHSVQHITTLVNDLLDLGRLEAGFDTRRELVSLDGVLKYTLDTFEGEIKRKNLKVAVDVPAEMHPLRANPIRIRQMLDNLVENAIKYTPEGGRIRVSAMEHEQQIILEVADTGPGIPPAEQHRIFEKFYRASNAPEGVSGTGLGLAIVKTIVENHQGRVWVESKLGQGSTFFVVLPIAESKTPLGESRPGEQ